MNILILDDSAAIRQILKKLLYADAYDITVIEASSVAEACTYLENNNPDFAILDIKLPDGSGIDILKKIKSESPDTVVVMLSNYTEEPFRLKCREENADYFFDKTTEFYFINNVLEQGLQKRPASRPGKAQKLKTGYM